MPNSLSIKWKFLYFGLRRMSKNKQIMILGVGNILFSDEGVGIHVVQALGEEYLFSSNVAIEDGGVLGIRLLGIISQADDLIVVDAIRNGGPPGTLYRLDGDAIPGRIRAKNSPPSGGSPRGPDPMPGP